MAPQLSAAGVSNEATLLQETAMQQEDAFPTDLFRRTRFEADPG
jgi:hypothetical protein